MRNLTLNAAQYKKEKNENGRTHIAGKLCLQDHMSKHI
jgi:hypothetical protein